MSLPGLLGAATGPGGVSPGGVNPGGVNPPGVNLSGAGPAPATGKEEGTAEPFADALRQVLDQVEGDQRAAEEMGRRLAAGEVTDLSQVMLASEKAYLSLATLVQVRNKLLEAYQEFMRMQM